MASNRESVYQRIRERLHTEWNDNAIIHWPGTTIDPDTVEEFVGLDITDIASTFQGIGCTDIKVMGRIVGRICFPINSGDKRANDLADQFANIFTNFYDDTLCLKFYHPPVLDVIGNEKPFFRINVILRFEYWYNA